MNVPPKIYTLSAAAVGYLLIGDTTANEQNALGNWLMLVAQVLCTNASFKQLQSSNNFTQKDVVNMMQKMVDSLEHEIANLKSANNLQ